MFFLVLLSGPAGQASAVNSVVDLGELHAFIREADITADDCAKTWQIKFDLQAECKVSLWPVDNQEISFQPIALIGLWQYRDADFKATVTFTREAHGYSVRLDTNDVKFKDRLHYKVARKYVVSAIQEKKFEKFQTLVARAGTKIKTGKGFQETHRGALHVYTRGLDFATGGALHQKCAEVWDGFKCTLSFLRNNRGETLLTPVAPVKIRAGGLTLSLKSYPGWKDGTAFSALNLQIRADRFQRDFSVHAADYDELARQLPRLEFKASQVAGDNEPGGIYSQILTGGLRAMTAPVVLNAEACRAAFSYQTGFFRGRCEVPVTWPGLLAQPSQVFTEFIDRKGVGSIVTVSVLPTGWRVEFSGEEKNVGKFEAVEPHFNVAAQKAVQWPSRLFFAH